MLVKRLPYSWDFSKIKVTYQIFGGYAVPIFLSVCAAILVYFHGVRRVNDSSKQLDAVRVRVDEVEALAYSILAMQRAARAYIISRDINELEGYEQWDNTFYEQSEKLRYLIQSPDQRETLKQIIELGDRVNEFDRRLISYIKLGKMNKAEQTARSGEGKQAATRLKELVEKFTATEQVILAARTQERADALAFLSQVVFGTAGITTLLGIIIGAKISAAIGQKMNQQAAAIAKSAAEIAATIEQQERSAVFQSAATSETTTHLDRLSFSSQQAAEETTHSSACADRALTLTHQGATAVAQTLATMATLEEKVQDIAGEIGCLDQKTHQIAEIAQLVAQLATQTNMLALNAAIEAVRAGDKGRGFGVIATEIRKLADLSKESADKIHLLLADIEATLRSTIKVTQEGTTTVSASNQITQQTAEAFRGVREAIHQVVASTTEISIVAKEQVTAIHQVLDATNTIDTSARENAAGITQVKIAIQQLNDAAQALQTMV
ncbi:methyl-accepting chemotaxis protein [Laspinema sp. D1]|uniref:Methyl-accepting chemotaxis protein n=1 Tax=Laspinema palackyanum D2a TaxID=2953684 RepID=A0ABT2MTR8_9CYAN|nr:methyl-accepting chemotaxis protein [Laspinema sp. D2a]